MMNGRIWVKSELGHGSQFHFTVRLDNVANPAPRQRPALTANLRGLRVLIVDDNETNCRILRDALSRWEMRPMIATSGFDALRELDRAVVDMDPYTLILTDFNMPSMDGLELVVKIRERVDTSATFIMMLTSSGQRSDAARCRSLGVTSYLVKPIRLSELRDAMLRLLTSTVMSRESQRARIQPGATRSLNILLAEDNAVNQLVMLRLLAKHGHRVSVAATGRQALEAHARERFDLVFMDVQMPELDGFEATREIRRREGAAGARLPIVALTAHAMSGDRERCLDAGMDDYLTKPIDAKALAEILAKYAELAAADPASAEPDARSA
jgi:CheY-like chemotaxis protein